MKVLKVAIILVLSLCCQSFGADNDSKYYKPYVLKGHCFVENGSYETFESGQLYIKKKTDFELRLKQNTFIRISDDPLALTDELIMEKGIIGLNVAKDTVLIKTTFADIRARYAVISVSLTDNIVRLCVIKGRATIMQKTNIVEVVAGQEIAASKNKLSKKYKFLDDLRYVYYWTSPDKEPSLMP